MVSVAESGRSPDPQIFKPENEPKSNSNGHLSVVVDDKVAQDVQTPSDHGTERASTLRDKLRKPIKFHLAFLSLLLILFIVSIDATALGVSIPTISNELQGTTLEAFWANLSFTLVVVIVQPIYTSVSDVVGRKLPLYTAFILFGIGSIVFAVVIVGRVIQALGGGGLDVLNEVIIADITTLNERAFYIGLISIPMALGTILGPVLGAAFSEYVTWRWINLPLIGICLPMCVFCLDLKPMPDTFREQLARLDWVGMALFTAGATLFSLPLSWGGSMYPWRSPQTIVPLVIGVILLGVFAWYESKPIEPMFPYRIFNNRTASATLVGSFIHGLILYTLAQYLPLVFQSVYLRAPLQASVLLVAFCAVLMAFTGFAAICVEWTRKYLWEIWLGWVFTAVGTGLFSLWDSRSSLAEIVGFQVIAAIGLGTLFTVPPIPMQASAKRAEDQGLAVGILVSFRLFGALIGLSIASTVLSTQFSQAITSLDPLPEALAMLNDPQEALSFIPYLRTVEVAPETMEYVREAYAQAFRPIFYIMGGLGAVGFLASLLTRELTIESEEKGRQAFQG
ncbi:putative efflux pump antibiotic resistance protein [Hypoxylon trugodes]|uniref:putative efflux pump antibiotic resistance protein n=1 Tax=Hypoxylon trugodes TaxID=326681 RepID=UPI00218D6DAC|nr:putative efflux pump antibiotic resistance protein [Hypoxylon trugodes]KAI1386560.1 putative efflux pump antibiotic resistance protein [Hypoxylon trugodes]